MHAKKTMEYEQLVVFVATKLLVCERQPKKAVCTYSGSKNTIYWTLSINLSRLP